MISLTQMIFWVSLISLLTSLLFLKTKTKSSTHSDDDDDNNNKLVPPGPPKVPLLGHLHLLGTLPYRSLCDLSKKHGPVMLLKLGSIPTVIVSSAAAAKELFKLHDLDSCSRPRLVGTRRFSYNFVDMNLSSYDDRWKELRKIFTHELFNTKRVQSSKHIREEEVSLMINSISQSSSSCSTPINLSEKLYSLTANITTRVAFGKMFRGGGLDNEKIELVVRRALAALGSFSMSDYFPSFGWVIDRFNGVHARLEKSFAELDAFFQEVVDYRISLLGTSGKEENIVDVLLRMRKDCSECDTLIFTQDCIKAVIMDIFLAGVETGASITTWAMTELIKSRRVMKKLQDEIRSYVKDQEQVRESDLEKLSYLKMVVKEVLRLHPPAPLLLPRETMSPFKLNGYEIDSMAHLHINVWAIGRDPDSWTNPEEFIPERFTADSNIDFRGQNYEFLPFGAGRRICPGMNMGSVTVELTLANMLLCFDWKLPNGMREEDVDVEEDFGLTIAKKSLLQLVPIRYFN